MARLRIIILDRDQDDLNNFKFAMWADVPAARQIFYANATLKSVWKDATASDIQALQNGSVTELSDAVRTPAGTSMAQVQGFLENRWATFQAQINSFNPWNRYGSTWDGTNWTVLNNG